MMNIQEQLFYRYYMFSKEDVLYYLNEYIALVEIDSLGKNSQASIDERKKFIQNFINLMRPSKLPRLDAVNRMDYDIIFTGAKLEFYQRHISEIDLNEDNTEVDCLTIDEEELLLDYESSYISIEEYAAQQGVRISTVQKWLDKGMLKFAKPINSTWEIPIIQGRPGNELSSYQYDFKGSSNIKSFEFPLVKLSSTITIDQDYKHKEIFHCNFYNPKCDLNEDFDLTRDEEQRLAFLLLTSGNVEVRESSMQVPIFDRNDMERDESI